MDFLFNSHEVDIFIIPILEARKQEQRGQQLLRPQIPQAAGVDWNTGGLTLWCIS